MFNRKLIDEHISVNPEIQQGRPCIKGTRTPVYVILEAMANGMTFQQVQEEFSPVTTEDIHACMLYAAILTDEQELFSQTTA